MSKPYRIKIPRVLVKAKHFFIFLILIPIRPTYALPLNKFVASSNSVLTALIEETTQPHKIVLNIAPDIPGGENALLNVTWRRPFILHEQPPGYLKTILTSNKAASEHFKKILLDYYFNFLSIGNSSLVIEEILNQFYFIGNFGHGMVGYNSDIDFKKNEPSENTHSKYWLALIPKRVVTTGMNLQIETFSEGDGKHMQIRAELNAPVLLLPQDPEALSNLEWSSPINAVQVPSPEDAYNLPTQQPILIKGEIIYSLMALKFQEGPKSFSFTNGLTGSLAVGTVLTSKTHMALDQLPRGSYIRDYKLSLSFDQQQILLKYILSKTSLSPKSQNVGEPYRLPTLYNTVFYNCISAILEALNVALTLNSSEPAKGINVYLFNPFNVPEYLLDQGIITNNKMTILNNLKNYATLAKNSSEKIAKIYQDYRPIIMSNTLENCLRKFAFEVAQRKWPSSDLDLVLTITSRDPSLLLRRSIKEIVAESLVKKTIEITDKNSSQNLIDIAEFMDQLMIEAIRSGAEEAFKKVFLNPNSNFRPLFIELLKTAQVS